MIAVKKICLKDKSRRELQRRQQGRKRKRNEEAEIKKREEESEGLISKRPTDY